MTAPPPLTEHGLQSPSGMELHADDARPSTPPAVLAAQGPKGCPPNSRLGSGNALVEVPFGTGSGHEIPEVQAVVGPPQEGNMVVLFYANGQTPRSPRSSIVHGRSAAP